MKKLLYILILTLLAIPSIAQDQCAIALSEAEDNYELGRLYEIPEMINECIEQGFTKEQKVRAYRLLTLTYLFLNYYEKADSSYLKLLKLSPEYNINEELDPSELINHHQKFTTKPIYYLTLGKVGVNVSYSNVLMDYSISSSQNGSSSYTTVLGFHAGFGGERVLYGNLHLSAEFLVTNIKMHLTDKHWDFYTTDMDLSQTEFDLPVLLKYNFPIGNINAFAEAGISPSFILNSAVQNIEGTYIVATDDGTGFEEFPVQPRPEISTSKFTPRFNYSTIIGAGINYKIGLNYLVFEARYSIGMLNATKPSERWREDLTEARELKFPTGHVSDDYKINNLSFLIGFVKPLYKPRKIK